MGFQHALYLVRHGETDWNKEGRFQGGIDIPLNDKGRDQAKGNGKLLATLLVDQAPRSLTYYASPLSRAHETATLIQEACADKLADIQLDNRLREMAFGEWEGHTQAELSESVPEMFKERADDPWNFRPPGGENYADLDARLKGFVAEITSDSVVVCHGGTIRALLVMLTGADLKSLMKEPIPQNKVMFVRNGNLAYLSV